MPLQLRTQILDLLYDHPKNLNTTVRIHSLLGYMFTASVEDFCDNYDVSVKSIDVLALQAGLMLLSAVPLTDCLVDSKMVEGPCTSYCDGSSC